MDEEVVRLRQQYDYWVSCLNEAREALELTRDQLEALGETP